MITALALISGNALIDALIYLVIVGLIAWLCWWLVGYAAPPEPFRKIANVLIAVIVFIVLVNFLLSLIGRAFIAW